MSNILVIGDLYTETQFFVDSIPLEDQFSFSASAATISGSKSLNAARTFSKLRDSVTFFGKIGEDPEGKNISEDLASKGIKPILLTDPQLGTGKISVVTSKLGKSSVILYSGANSNLVPNDLKLMEQDLKHTDYIYSSTAIPLETLYELVSIAGYLKIPIFLDVPNKHKDVSLDKIKNVTFFAPNRQETELIIGSKVTSIDEAKKAALTLRASIQGVIFITLDKDGCIFLKQDSTTPIHIQAPQVHAVDETASGDIFRAVFSSEWLKNKNIEESLKKATKIASLSTEIQGVNETFRSLDFTNNI